MTLELNISPKSALLGIINEISAMKTYLKPTQSSTLIMMTELVSLKKKAAEQERLRISFKRRYAEPVFIESECWLKCAYMLYASMVKYDEKY